MEASYNWIKLIQIQVVLEHFKIKVNFPPVHQSLQDDLFDIKLELQTVHWSSQTRRSAYKRFQI